MCELSYYIYFLVIKRYEGIINIHKCPKISAFLVDAVLNAYSEHLEALTIRIIKLKPEP